MTIIKKEKIMDNKLSKKDIASILYMTYMNKYCEDTFSFDHGDTFSKIKTYYNNLIQKVVMKQ